MYCSVCGNEIKADMRFCSKCGTSISWEKENTEISPKKDVSGAVSLAPDVVEIKADLEKSLEVIFKIENDIQTLMEFDECRIAIEKKKKEIAEEWTKPQTIGFIIMVIVIPIWGLIEKGFLSLVVTALFMGTVFFVFINPIIKCFSSNEEKAEQYYKDNMKLVDKEEAEFMAEFEKYCESDEVAFARKVVPEEYFDTDSVQFLIKMLNDKRADSFKEAINLYEEYLHREYMESMQREQLSMQGQQLHETRQLSAQVQEQTAHMQAQTKQMQAQTAYMKQISRNTRATAKAARANAFISLANGCSQSETLRQIERNTR